MITVDQYLIILYHQGVEKLSSKIPHRDKKILISLAKQMGFGNFLTENQGKLLVKIFKENRSLIEFEKDKLNFVVDYPVWSQNFRIIEHIRKMFIDKSYPNYISLDFTYNKSLKLKISEIRGNFEGQVLSENKRLLIPLTEKNIFLLVNELKKYNFQISDDILKFYEEIEKISQQNKNYFDIFTTENKKLISAVEKDIGPIDKNKLLLLQDRKIRYQYNITEKISSNSLAEKLANRNLARVFVNSQTHSLVELFESLKVLDRFPIMMIFNGHDSKECLENLADFIKIQENLKTGIYFRFDNSTDENKKFNELVSTSNLNSRLEDDTQIVGISNGKLPKFMLKDDWYPRTVISFTNNFKSNKTTVYSDAVDLVIYYNKKEPLGGGFDAIV